MIEPNAEATKLYDKEWVTINSNFQDITLDVKFDFITISHVLYNMNQFEIKDFIKKAYSLLSDTGVLLIMHHSSLVSSLNSLLFDFCPNLFDVEAFLSIFLKENSMSFNADRLHSQIEISSDKELETFIKFLLYEDTYSFYNKDKSCFEKDVNMYIKNYIENNPKPYLLDTNHVCYLVAKNY